MCWDIVNEVRQVSKFAMDFKFYWNAVDHHNFNTNIDQEHQEKSFFSENLSKMHFFLFLKYLTFYYAHQFFRQRTTVFKTKK